MHVKVLVHIGVVQFQAGVGKRLELRADLLLRLAARRPARRQPPAERGQARREAPVGVDQIRNALRRQHRPRSAGQRHVQAHAQPRQAMRPFDRIGRGRLSHHQAGGGQRCGMERLLDRLVDRRIQAEVVGRDDQVPHKVR